MVGQDPGETGIDAKMCRSTIMAVKKTPHQPARKVAAGEAAAKVRTPSQRLRDMRAHGKEIRQSKESAVAFLQRAGILNNAGKLTKPYRG